MYSFKNRADIITYNYEINYGTLSSTVVMKNLNIQIAAQRDKATSKILVEDISRQFIIRNKDFF